MCWIVYQRQQTKTTAMHPKHVQRNFDLRLHLELKSCPLLSEPRAWDSIGIWTPEPFQSEGCAIQEALVLKPLTISYHKWPSSRALQSKPALQHFHIPARSPTPLTLAPNSGLCTELSLAACLLTSRLLKESRFFFLRSQCHSIGFYTHGQWPLPSPSRSTDWESSGPRCGSPAAYSLKSVPLFSVSHTFYSIFSSPTPTLPISNPYLVFPHLQPLPSCPCLQSIPVVT